MEFTDVFLTHDWGEDENGRSNHARVSRVNKFLQSKSLRTWFDEERMTGNIRDKMAEGIEKTKLIIVFITEKYRYKVNSNNAADNCYFEFNYATLEKTGNFMVPVVMEPRMKNSRVWKGRLGAELGTHLYVDLSDDDPSVFEKKCEELYQLIQNLIEVYDKAHPTHGHPAIQTHTLVHNTSTESLSTPIDSTDPGNSSPVPPKLTRMSPRLIPKLSESAETSTSTVTPRELSGQQPPSKISKASPRPVESSTEPVKRATALTKSAMAVLDHQNHKKNTKNNNTTAPDNNTNHHHQHHHEPSKTSIPLHNALTSISTTTSPRLLLNNQQEKSSATSATASNTVKTQQTLQNFLSTSLPTTTTASAVHSPAKLSNSLTASIAASATNTSNSSSNLPQNQPLSLQQPKFSFASSFLKSLNDTTTPTSKPTDHSPVIATTAAATTSTTTTTIHLSQHSSAPPTFSFANSLAQSLQQQQQQQSQQKTHTISLTNPLTPLGGSDSTNKTCPWCSTKNDLTATTCLLCKKPIPDPPGRFSTSFGDPIHAATLHTLKKTCPWCHGKNDLSALKCTICSNSLEAHHLPSDLHPMGTSTFSSEFSSHPTSVNIKVTTHPLHATAAAAGTATSTEPLQRSPRLSLKTGALVLHQLGKGQAP